MAGNNTTNPIRYTSQEMDNKSFDDVFNQNTVEVLVHDPTSNTLNRMTPPNPMNLKPFDYVSMVISPVGTETYTFKSGGSGGTTTNTVVIVYTDATRTDIVSVTKT